MKRRRVWIGLGVFAALLVVTAAVALFVATRSGRPRRSGAAAIPGLSAPVAVAFDRWGVPHVTAASAADLAAAVGYLHANDRFFQMELGRRAAAGRLSELFGEQTLDADRELRTLRLRQGAETMWGSAGAESRAWLGAYARGVNAWLDERGSDLPPELMGASRPEPWTPVDSLGFAFLMARDLSFWNGRPEEERFRWLRALGRERTQDLLGGEPLVVAAEVERLAASEWRPTVASPEAAVEGSPGSNNWALGSTWTASGSPIVANDPHLPLRLPGTWYQVMLRAPGYEAAGMTLPGLPGVVIGRGPRVAWAMTHTMLDDQDLFFEEPDAAGKLVRRGDGWAPVEVETQTIRLRGGGETTLELRSTDRGPLLPADPDQGLPPRSLAWTAYLPADPLAALLAVARARSVGEIPGAIDGFVCPSQNLVIADADGGLLHVIIGGVPDRMAGDGRLPAPGWDPAWGWRGLLPRSTNLTILAPADDLLVTANDDVRPPAFAQPYTADFDTAHRAARIREVLQARRGWTAIEQAGVQSDVTSTYARQVVGLLGGPYDGDAERARSALAAWDGEMALAGPAALFALVERELRAGIFDDEAHQGGLERFSDRERLLRALAGAMRADWFDDVATADRHETRVEVVAAALQRGWAAAGADGKGPADWSWGKRHALLLHHPLGGLPLVGRWLDRGPYAMPGSSTTVAAFGGGWRGERAPVSYGPSMRWVADLADPDRSLAVLPGGQSGHPFDPHYDDQVPLYLRGELRPVAWSETAIAAATVSVLRLEPAAAGAGPAAR